jgi:hypothetical protein
MKTVTISYNVYKNTGTDTRGRAMEAEYPP